MKTLLKNCVIHGVDKDAILLSDNKIEKIGFYDDLNHYVDKYIDVDHGIVLPGFNDSHMHLLGVGNFVSSLQLQDCYTVEEVYDLVRTSCENKKPGEWIVGRGWNQDNFDKVQFPTKEDLDKITLVNPICLTRCCGHVAVCNTKALELAKITKETTVSGGDIEFETGLVKEMAIELLHHAFPPLTKEDLKTLIIKGMEECNQNGITSIQSDDFVSLTKDYHLPLEAFRELCNEGKCSCRVNEQCQFIVLDDLKMFVAENQLANKGNEVFKLGPIKVVGDGSLGARTALMSSPYADANTSGMANYTQEEFDMFVKLGEELGMGTIIHTIGDGCLDMVLNSFEKYGTPGNPHRSGIVHVQITRDDQLKRIEKLKLHCYIQSCFIDYDCRIVEQRVGSKAKTSYAFKTLLETTTVSNGSDSPVEPLHCLKGIECAITRSTIGCDNPYRKEEALTIEQAIDSYTKNGAYASFEENIKGKLEAGMLADFVVLDRNPYTIKSTEIHNIQVKMTIFDGKVVYMKS